MSLRKINGESVSYGVNPAEYHAIGAGAARNEPGRVMSRSALKAFDECPAKWVQMSDKEQTKAMEWGSLMDARVTTPSLLEKFAVAPAVYPCEPTKKDPRTEKPWNMAANFCKEWHAGAEESGLTPITAKVWEQSIIAYGKLHKDKIVGTFLDGCEYQAQVLVEWHDEPTGIIVPVKCLLDIVPSKNANYLADFKTTNDARPRAWGRRTFDDQLHVQGALYLDAFNIASGEDRNTFAHVIQESAAPYMTARRVLSEEFLELGRLTYRRQLERYCRCLQSGDWPDFDTDQEEKGLLYQGWRIVEPEKWMIAA